MFAIALGGGLGALARYYLSAAISQTLGSAFPYGILAVNVLGGLLMGIIVALGAVKLNYSPEMRTFLTTGLLGGFTTFSAFSLDAGLMLQRGDWAGAFLYAFASVVLSVAALFGGFALVRSFA